jgi:hypothetical protein
MAYQCMVLDYHSFSDRVRDLPLLLSYRGTNIPLCNQFLLAWLRDSNRDISNLLYSARIAYLLKEN